jgi:AcrR family transcriptional regulator
MNVKGGLRGDFHRVTRTERAFIRRGQVRQVISESATAGPVDVGGRLARVTRQVGSATPLLNPVLPARAQAAGTLRRIYETALVQFGERGFHAVSVRDLTGELGLQASSLYAHVPSKAHLLGDLVRLGHEEHRDQLRLALLEVGTDPTEQIAALTRAHVRVHATYPLLTRVCNRELASIPDDQRDSVLTIRLEAERLFLEVIERGQRLGAFAPTDPMLAVAAIGAMGIRVAEWWSPDVGVSVDEVADTYAQFAVKLLT